MSKRYIEFEQAIKKVGLIGNLADSIKDVICDELAELPTIEVKGGDLEDAILLTKDAYSDLCLRASQVSDKAECDNCIWSVCNYNKVDWEVSEDCISNGAISSDYIKRYER